MKPPILEIPIRTLIAEHPFVNDFFAAHGIEPTTVSSMTFTKMADTLEETFFNDLGTNRKQFVTDFVLFIEQMQSLFTDNVYVHALSILPGQDKSGSLEQTGITLKSGEVTAIVGPTGSGKSRLLEDVECLAQGDTPSKRKINVNGEPPTDEMRFSTENRLIAQLSQNMNFVMDISVQEFITLHAESRMVPQVETVVEKIFNSANQLAGEPFDKTVPVTELSGGQSRALMIADTALLSTAPIILIDEIENAGVDKVSALDLLISAQKIVLISTHDPLLALLAHQRLVIKNGGIHTVIKTSEFERQSRNRLLEMDREQQDIRQRLRRGESIQA